MCATNMVVLQSRRGRLHIPAVLHSVAILCVHRCTSTRVCSQGHSHLLCSPALGSWLFFLPHSIVEYAGFMYITEVYGHWGFSTGMYSMAAFPHKVRGPNWTEEEMMVLIGQKRLEWDGRHNCNQPALAKFVYGTAA